MADITKVKGNIKKLIAAGAQESDIDEYIATEGVTLDDLKAAQANSAAVSPAMRQEPGPPVSGAPAPAAPSQPTAPQAPAEETGVVEDVAKSAGIGLAQGAIAIPGLPGTVEQLGRMGIDKVAKGLGYDPRLSERTFLPTFGDIKSGIESYTGPFYKPKTVAGEYARTLGEFAPLAFLGPAGGGMSAGARALNVAAPAIVSETAGQVTKGTALEPWARAGGALAGGMLPNAAMRTISPAASVTPDAALANHVASLRANGVNSLDAAQITGSERLGRLNFAAKRQNFGPGETRAIQAQEEFNNAVARSFGSDVRRITPDVIDGAHTRIGGVMDQISQRTNIPPDANLAREIARDLTDYLRDTSVASRIPRVEAFADDIRGFAGRGMTGEQFAVLRRTMNESRGKFLKSNNPEAANAIGDMMGRLDATLARHATAGDAAALREARTHYRNLMSTQKAVDRSSQQSTLGHVSPANLFNTTKAKISANTAGRGRDPLHELARSGQAVLAPVKTSGTSENALAISTFKDAPLAIGAEAISTLSGAPGVGLALTAAKSTVPGILGRAWMSRPMQAWLANDRAVPAMNAYARTRPQNIAVPIPRMPLNVNPYLPLAATELNSGPTLSGGFGPDFDENGSRKVGAFAR